MVRLAAQHVRGDVGQAAALVFQQVRVRHEMLAQAEVGDGHLVTRLFQYDVAKLEIPVDDLGAVELIYDQTLLFAQLILSDDVVL